MISPIPSKVKDVGWSGKNSRKMEYFATPDSQIKWNKSKSLLNESGTHYSIHAKNIHLPDSHFFNFLDRLFPKAN